MPSKRPETKRRKIAKMLIEKYQPKNAQDIQKALKDRLVDTNRRTFINRIIWGFKLWKRWKKPIIKH